MARAVKPEFLSSIELFVYSPASWFILRTQHQPQHHLTSGGESLWLLGFSPCIINTVSLGFKRTCERTENVS